MEPLTREDFLTPALKHLPPSAAELRLLDVGGVAASILTSQRHDLECVRVSVNVQDWHEAPGTADAVVAYDRALTPEFLTTALRVLRPGGRLVMVNPAGVVSEAHGQTLEQVGYVRILVEAAVSGTGVLIRGEKPHQTADTLQRVQVAAGRDANTLDLTTYTGRYIYLLIRQQPNKPVWKLSADERIDWQAVAVRPQRGSSLNLLAFSSLPKAVAFMQPAVLQGVVWDVNKVAKFSHDVALSWSLPVILNPELDTVRDAQVVMVAVDPAMAEAPDE